MLERRTLQFEPEILAGLELPCIVAHGTEDGPRLALIAGIHGCEYSSIAAVTRFMADLDTSELTGTIVAVPVVNLGSFRGRTPFVSPQDGKNLNRCFPGSYDGTYSDALARAVFDEVISASDVLLDLHGGDLVEALEPFSLYDESAVEGRSRELAIAYGLRYVVRSPRGGAPISGTTSGAAAAVGVPAVIAEAGGCGLLEESAVDLHLAGIENAIRHLGMHPGAPASPRTGMCSVDRFVWVRCRAEGWWEPSARVGDEVLEAQVVGVVRNLYGDVVEQIVAPEDGVLLFLTSSPAVSADGLLFGLGAEVTEITS
jgi:uncharacterized protein